MASVVLHMVLALALTGMLAGQAGALVTVLRSRRVLAARRPRPTTDLVWVTIPVAIVLFLAARSWIVAFDLNRPAMAILAPVEVSAGPRLTANLSPLIARTAATTPRPGTTAVSIERR